MYIRLTVISNFSKLQFVLHILLLRNFYSPDAHHANHGKQRVNHHFRHGADSVYKKYSDFKLFEIAVCFAHFDFFEISTLVMRMMLTMANIVFIIISDIAHTVYIRFTLFSNFSKLQFVLHVLTFSKFLFRWRASCYHGKHSLNHHFWHGTHSVYTIYSDFKLFEIAVSFAHFDLFEISTPVMRIMLTMANIV